MEENSVIDFEKVLGLEITTAKGQVFSRKRVKNAMGEVEFKFNCYLGSFYPVYDPEGMYFCVDYKGATVRYTPDDQDILDDLWSNDADVLKKAMNSVYQRAKGYVNREKYCK